MGMPYNATLLACFCFLNPDLGFDYFNLTQVFVLNFSSNFSELSLKEHLLSKDTNYTITFSMSAVRHCAEAMFLIVFANATCIFFCHFSFVSRSQNVRPWNSSLRRKNCCLFPGSGYFFVYTVKLYRALPWSWRFMSS